MTKNTAVLRYGLLRSSVPPADPPRYRHPGMMRALLCALLLAGLAWPAAAWGQDSVHIDDFGKTYDLNEAPDDWGIKTMPFTDDEGVHVRFVHDGSDHYIHVKSGEGNSYVVGKLEFEFEIEDYTFLEWEWKVVTLPRNGDVRVEERDDQAGSMCIVVDFGFMGADETLCYIWENEGPKGAELTSVKREDSKYIILRAADSDSLNEWYKERRNIQEDFKRLFGYIPDDDAIIGIQIDSDSTESSGEAYYRNIFLKKS